MINYELAAIHIMAKCRCSKDEAWSGLATAFLYVDTTMDEAAQYSYLVEYGAKAVRKEWSRQYVDKTSGVKRFVTSDFSDLKSDSKVESDLAFLEAFPEGMAREYARLLSEGKHKFTMHTCLNFVRRRYSLNNRTQARRVYESVRIRAAKLR